MKNIVSQEIQFGSTVLVDDNEKKFFRLWRKLAILHANTSPTPEVNLWSDIRNSAYTVKEKSLLGSELISRLKKHLCELQGWRCCYCRRPFDGTGHARPIDHVLPRQSYKRFTFQYRNLAVACNFCNSKKLNTNWSNHNPSSRKYITETRCLNFFHPRFHNYDAHIRYLFLETNGASITVYKGLTDQGRHLCDQLLKLSAKRNLEVTANHRFSEAMSKLTAQINLVNTAHLNSGLQDFMVALELSSTPR